MSSTFGNLIKISVFGESHGEAIGVVIDGLPAGESIDIEQIEQQMKRRAPGRDKTSTPRSEADVPKILSGYLDGRTTGAPLCAVIENTNTKSSDYSDIAFLPRPSHADYTGFVRYKGYSDFRGGGHFSGRLTAPLTFAGAVCRQILERKGITIGSHIYSIGEVKDTPFDMVGITPKLLRTLSKRSFSTVSPSAETEMRNAIESARANGDSVGGIIECAVVGMPAGIGSPMFDGVENRISSIVFGIPAVKGIEFGAGFSVSEMRGSQCNDPFYMVGKKVKTRSNNNGGILGGITDGMPIVFRAAVKPTPSIGKTQDTVNLKTGENAKLTIRGRHDPCIVPRALPVIESAAAIALLDMMTEVSK